jgi:hypothetical protein
MPEVLVEGAPAAVLSLADLALPEVEDAVVCGVCFGGTAWEKRTGRAYAQTTLRALCALSGFLTQSPKYSARASAHTGSTRAFGYSAGGIGGSPRAFSHGPD